LSLTLIEIQLYDSDHQKRLKTISRFLFIVGNLIGFIWWMSLLFIGEFLLFFVFPIIYIIGLLIAVGIISRIILWSFYFTALFIDKLIEIKKNRDERTQKQSVDFLISYYDKIDKPTREILVKNLKLFGYPKEYSDSIKKIDSNHFKIDIASKDGNEPDWVMLEIAQDHNPGDHIERVSRKIESGLYDFTKNITSEFRQNEGLNSDIVFNLDWGHSAKVRLYENGQKEWEYSLPGSPTDINYKGNFRDWFPNGIQKSEGKYKDGKKDGLWKYWWYNGSLGAQIEYKNGLPNGNEETFGLGGFYNLTKWEDGVFLGSFSELTSESEDNVHRMFFTEELSEDKKLQNQRYAKANEKYKEAKRIGFIDTL